MAAKRKEDAEVEILEIQRDTATFRIKGTRPMILNRMSEKAKRELLLPRPKKNAAEKASSLKHNPVQEFLDSPYRLMDKSAPTLLGMPAGAFKKAISNAALDTPGAKKAQIGRLTYVEGDLIPIYGVPQIFMSVTRSADMNHTPDVRTRCIIPNWACEITVVHISSIIKAQAVTNLLAAAGLIIGIGDWRNEKGSNTYGQFLIADKNDKEWDYIVAHGGRAAQIEAMENPLPYDRETEEMLTWFDEEVKRRGKFVAPKVPREKPGYHKRKGGVLVAPA